MTSSEEAAIEAEIDKVFAANRRFRPYDHRKEYWWVKGYLGNITSKVMFLAENPSLRGIKRANKNPDLQDPELQWAVSRGDLIFRGALFKADFKAGGPTSKGGWHCYITNIVKMADVASNWKKRGDEDRWQIVKAFVPVLRKELELMKPDVIVVMGERPKQVFLRLQEMNLLQIPLSVKREYVTHYAWFNYIPSDSDRVRKYEDEFKRIQHLPHSAEWANPGTAHTALPGRTPA
jgi:hypothetical protein